MGALPADPAEGAKRGSIYRGNGVGSLQFSGLRRMLARLQICSRPLDGSNAQGGAASVSNDKGGLWLSLVERFVRDGV